jgi:membrane-associated phospholipid phosphatase
LADHAISAKGKQATDAAAGDSNYELMPGEDPDNHLFFPLAKHLANDQRAFWTAPAHFRVKDLEWITPFAGATAAFMVSDSWLSKQIPLGQIDRSKKFSDYATFSLIGAGAGSFFFGHLTGNDRMSETGLLSGEAALNSTAVAYLLKNVMQRPRPYLDNGNGTFFKGGSSFPSEHAAIAWSVASVLAHEYPGTLTQILAYGLATGVSATRVTGQQHFASDVIIGSALGWYFGRQVYRSHHDTSLGGEAWGDFISKEPGEKARNPENMGSPYMPLDSWIYPSLERLAALGYIKTAYLGIRPWTRLECARMLDEAEQQIGDEDEPSGEAPRIYRELAKEFSAETGRLNGAANAGASLDSVYARFTNISGTSLRDGYHFGQTIINDYGRPYGEGFNSVDGFTAHSEAGPLSISVQGEYQHAPAVASHSSSVLSAIAAVDGNTIPSPDGRAAIDRFALIEGSVGLTFRKVMLSFGRQNLWLGPGESGPLLWSNNAQPVTMLRLDNTSPFDIPLLSRVLGPARIDFLVGQLSGQKWIYSPPASVGLNPNGDPRFLLGPNISPQPFVHENKISFKPTANLELGMGVTAVFGGQGLPFTWHEFLRSYYGHNANTAINPGKRFSSFDFSYRIPGLRKWLTIYNDSIVGDEISPIGSTRPVLNPGIYMPQVPRLSHLQFRAEGFKDSPDLGVLYIDRRYRSGYTNDRNLIGSWVGRQGLGGQAWATYSFSPRSELQLGYRHQQVDDFLLHGGRLSDYSLRGNFFLHRQVSLSGLIQYEQWHFPVLAANAQADVTASFQLTFYPHFSLISHSSQ